MSRGTRTGASIAALPPVGGGPLLPGWPDQVLARGGRAGRHEQPLALYSIRAELHAGDAIAATVPASSWQAAVDELVFRAAGRPIARIEIEQLREEDETA